MGALHGCWGSTELEVCGAGMGTRGQHLRSRRGLQDTPTPLPQISLRTPRVTDPTTSLGEIFIKNFAPRGLVEHQQYKR